MSAVRTPGAARRAARLRRATGLFALVFVTYGTGLLLTWHSFGATVGPAFFPTTGITVAATLLARRTLWPAVLAAVALAEFLIDLYYGESLTSILGFVLANWLVPVVGAIVVLRRCTGRPDLLRRNDLTAFLVGACLIGPLAGGLVGGWAMSRGGGVTWLANALYWTAGSAIGSVVVATPILLWPKQYHILKDRRTEVVGVLCATAVLSVAAFSLGAPPAMLILPVLAWAAFRLDMIGAALAGLVIAVLVNVMTRYGMGIFVNVDLVVPVRLALTQLFLAVMLVVALLIAQEVAGRTVAVQARESERRERLRLEALSVLAQRLSAALTPRDIGATVVDQVLTEAGATAMSLGLLGPDGRTLEWVVMEGYPPAVVSEYAEGVAVVEPTVATDTVRSARPVIVRSAAEYAARYPRTAHWVRISGAESVAGWPLVDGGVPFGALLLVWNEPQSLDAAQLAYGSAVATMVSQALVRARVYADEDARAAVLQAAVLPDAPAEVQGLELSVSYQPADVVQGLGGDWYDTLLLPDGRIYLAVGDVVGHGLQAVEDMAQLRSAGRVLAHQGLSPGRVLAELNGFSRHASQGKFATMAVAVVERGGVMLGYASAGHPPPLLRRARSGVVVRLGAASGPVLGPVPDAEFPETGVRVEPGDILLMYTDGLVERRGLDIDEGICRAVRAVAEWGAGVRLSEVCERLPEELAPRPRADDVCLLAIRFR